METQNSDDQEEESSSSPSSETMITNPRPNLRREPSFSRWCGDDDGSAHLLGHSPTASFDGVSIEVEGFELPLLPHDAIDPQQRTSYFRQRGTFAELKDRRHVHFDVEGGGGLHPNDSRAKLDLLEHAAHGHHPHSAVTMLKTAFYILVWYTFSTCLTLYNKALLGDKLGKFPAPLLMNTIHFTLQAVLSKAIGCYQHRGGTDGNFPMTWRDYFTKETGCQWLAMLPGIVFSRHQNIRSRSISNLLAPSPETAYLFSRMSFPRYCWVVPGCERRKKESGVMWCWNPMCVEHGTLILVAMRCGSHGTIGGVRFTKVASDGSCVVVPTALGTSLDVNLSNSSLIFISVTFATMCKSASPIFLLLFAFAFRLESPSVKLLGIILIISIGVLLTVVKETEFDFSGFVFVMLAAVMSGFRWSMTQILLQKDAYGLKNPITLMSYVSPLMAIITAIFSLTIDPWHDFHKNIYFDNTWHIMWSCLLMLIGGSLAFFMVLTEYILISATSAVTVTIAGVMKEAVTIVVAVFYFHDQFTWLKGVGLLTIMVGVSLFNWYKYQKFKKGQPNENGEHMSPTANVTSKYVILDERDFQDDDN